MLSPRGLAAGMKIAVLKERRPNETRVAATPDTVKRLTGQGAQMLVESGAGEAASYLDDAYRAAGATVVPDAAAALAEADVVFKVQRPLTAGEGAIDELALMRRGTVLIGM